MKLRSPVPPRRHRLEIVPLIDIMFFLLASFMLVSLTMSRQESIKVKLPAAAGGAAGGGEGEKISLAVDAEGRYYVGTRRVSLGELSGELAARHAVEGGSAVSISGDEAARHGAVVALLEAVRRAGFEKVAFQVRGEAVPAVP